jgi:hypothetical protein
VVRTYETDQGATTSFGAGDLIKVSLRFNLPESNCGLPLLGGRKGPSRQLIELPSVPCETYEITDLVPSGLTVITPRGFGTYEEKGSCFDWPVNVEEQRVSFFVTPRSETACRNGTLTYYARVVTPGTYVAEPTYIRSTRDPEQHNHSDAAIVTLLP